MSIENCGANSASFFFKAGKDTVFGDSLSTRNVNDKDGLRNSSEEPYTILGTKKHIDTRFGWYYFRVFTAIKYVANQS